MRVTILGRTGSMSGPQSAASSYLVQAGEGEEATSIVLDMGPGSFGALWRHMNPADVDAVALSHLHIDHCGDIMSMQIFRRWHPSGALGPIGLFAPGDVLARLRGLDGFSDTDTFDHEFDIHNIENMEETQVGCLSIQAYPVWHSVPCYALRITGPSDNHDSRVTLTYSGDTDYCEGVVAAAKNADLFLCECGFTKADTATGIHLDGARAARVAREAGVSSLLLTHIQPWTDPATCLVEAQEGWSGPLDIAQDAHTYIL